MATSWTERSGPSTSWTERTKTTTDQNSFLKKEDTFYLLLETGFKIVLARGWTARKDPDTTPTTNWTLRTQP